MTDVYVLDVRAIFATYEEAKGYYDQLYAMGDQAALIGVGQPGKIYEGSFLQLHRCTHNDPSGGPCEVLERYEIPQADAVAEGTASVDSVEQPAPEVTPVEQTTEAPSE